MALGTPFAAAGFGAGRAFALLAARRGAARFGARDFAGLPRLLGRPEPAFLPAIRSPRDAMPPRAIGFRGAKRGCSYPRAPCKCGGRPAEFCRPAGIR